jgi:hypothetical protein
MAVCALSYWVSTRKTTGPLFNPSHEQVPQDKRHAEYARCPEQLLCRAASLRRALELPVSAPDILRRVERVLDQLVNVC